MTFKLSEKLFSLNRKDLKIKEVHTSKMSNSAMEIDHNLRYPTLPPRSLDEPEWKYVMRRSMQEILPGVYLGPYASATRNALGSMLEAGITHVVCVRSNIESNVIRANHLDHFQYLLVQMEDCPTQTECIIPKIRMVSTFIENCLAFKGKVLIHGNAGMSRSPCLVIGYIMGKYGVPYIQAYRYVQRKRVCINIFDTFRRQLLEYEPILLANHQSKDMDATAAAQDPQYRITKRKIEEVELDEEEDEGCGQAESRPRIDSDSDETKDVEMDE